MTTWMHFQNWQILDGDRYNLNTTILIVDLYTAAIAKYGHHKVGKALARFLG